MEIAPANTNPFETNRLLQELSSYCGEVLRSQPRADSVKELAIKIISGEMHGALWMREPDSAAGVAILENVDGAGTRVLYLYVEKEKQAPQNVQNFLGDLMAYTSDKGGVFSVGNVIPGLSHDEQRSFLQPLGYVPLRINSMSFDISRSPIPEEHPLPYGKTVSVGINRIEDLVDLFATSYDDHKDRLFSASPRDPKGMGRKFLEDFFLDLNVPTTPWGCLGVEHEGRLVAALLAQEEYRSPKESKKRCIYDLMVDPEHQKKGMGKHLLSRLIREARDHGLTEVLLEVTEGNPAEKLYSKMGFKALPVTEDIQKGMWVRKSTIESLGLSL